MSNILTSNKGLILTTLLLAIVLYGCSDNDHISPAPFDWDPYVCQYNAEVLAPPGFKVNKTGQLGFDGYVRKFQFVSDQLGFIMARKIFQSNLIVLKTTNGGVSWDKMYTGETYNVLDMNFFDKNLGIISLDNRRVRWAEEWNGKSAILRTENGGLDWEEVVIEELEGRLNRIQFDNQGTVFAQYRLGDSLHIIKSENNGSSWTKIYNYELFEMTLPTHDFRVFNDKVYTIDGKGRIIIISKDGSTNIITNEESPFLRVYQTNPNTLLARNSDGLTKSNDGGITWEQTADISGDFLGFEDGLTGVLSKRSSCVSGGDAIHGTIQFASTFDGGGTWGVSEIETMESRTGNFINGQYIGNQIWRVWIGTDLYELTVD